MWIAEHPYMAAGIGVLGVVGLMVMSGGGGGSTAVTAGGSQSDPSLVAAGLATQQMQMQMQGAASQVNAQLMASQDNNATALAIAKVQADQNTQNMNLQATVAGKQIQSAVGRQRNRRLAARKHFRKMAGHRREVPGVPVR